MEMETANKRLINEKSGLFILIGLMGVGMVMGTTLSVIFWKLVGGNGMVDMQVALTNPEHVVFIRLSQTVLALCIFFIPPVFAAWLISRRPFSYIGFKTKISVQTFFWGFFLMAITILLSGSLASLNEMIPLTEQLKVYAQAMEDSYMKQVELMSAMNGIPDLVIAVLVMALAPAIFEEVFFRGGFQNMMQRATGKMWVSILITSLLFSAIHFSFYGFLSRVALSIVLGLLYAHTQNIWMPIVAHFINNAMGVFQIYYLRVKGLPLSEATEDKYPIWWGLFTLIALIYFFKYFKQSANGIRS